MKKMDFGKLISADQKRKCQKMQIRITASMGTKIREESAAPPRSEVELGLLLRAIKKTEADFQKEGKLIKHDRKWKLNI